MSLDQLDRFRQQYPEKLLSTHHIFSHIHTADRLFIGSGCSEPQYLVRSLVDYVKKNPTAFFDTEILHAWTARDAPYYLDVKLKPNFRANALFISNNNRDAINKVFTDYTPVHLSQVPRLFQRKLIPIDVALIQTSPPDEHGFMSLGISVDITKEAVASAPLVIVQANPHMPRVHGDTFIHITEVDYIVPYEEPLLEYITTAPDNIAKRIGEYVASIIEDGDTIQVGYGSIPNAILANLRDKKHLGVHTELLTDGIVELMKCGVVDNSNKSINRGKTVATFCMGSRATYDYIHDNPAIEFKPIDYTNNPLVIARQTGMAAVNGILGIDLSGQATAESAGKAFFNGIGGIVDFIRGAILAPKGKAILTLRAATQNEGYSRIVPFLGEGAGVTLNRADVHYVVTEYGIAYLHGKSIRERAMELIAIAHPKFRPWLIEEARKANLIYPDQLFIPGKEGEYPENLETWRVTQSGLQFFIRPVKISDEPLFKELGHALSDETIYRRFFTHRHDMPHEFLQKFVIIDYTEKMAVLAIIKEAEKEKILGVARYFIEQDTRTADIVLLVRDDYQHQGVGRELLSYLIYLGRKQGLLGLTAEVLLENRPMLNLLSELFEKKGFDVQKKMEGGVVYFKFMFRDT
jgi:acyl-CoA hydrolase/GNAT superfamily N-acetyltransferase